MYKIQFSKASSKDAKKLEKSDIQAYKKLEKLIQELIVHPRTGTGKPERLKHFNTERWSRHITDKHRLVYDIFETKIIIEILSVWGHYDDK